MPDICLIDGFGPVPVEQPKSVAELGELVRKTPAHGQALYPLAGRTMLDLGLPPTRDGIAVDVCALDQVIDYPARDMTITVQSGITIARLQAILAPENQRLPIDVPSASAATLGGILAVNASGPRRYGYGTLRDYVLGISAVNDEGQEIKAGGRVVKNVAGYDLCKLYIGSLGTLGIITQVTLKLRPLAEENALVALACHTEMLEPVLDMLQRSRTRPVCIDVLNRPRPLSAAGSAEDDALPWMAGERGRGEGDASWTILVGFESNAEAVQWQVQQLIREVKGNCTLDARMGCCGAPLWQGLSEFPARCSGIDGSLTFKASLLSGGIAAFCKQADAMPDRPLLQAHAGNGIVIGHLGPGLSLERAAAALERVRQLAAPFQGRTIVLRCPSAWKRTIDVWGPPRADVTLMRAIKHKLDPRGIFNPGRFVDGI
jgi:glycolate oxidase FAD binding subunit